MLCIPDKKFGMFEQQNFQKVSKTYPIVDEKFVVISYDAQMNRVLPGQYAFPFSLKLPDWLPQSHLCFNQPNLKRRDILNKFGVRYNLLAALESTEMDSEDQTQNAVVITEKVGITGIKEPSKMLHVRRLTIVAPEQSQPVLDQEIYQSGKIRKFAGLWGVGTCEVTATFARDILYPEQQVQVHVNVDNSACKVKVDKYRVKLLRRTQVFN